MYLQSSKQYPFATWPCERDSDVMHIALNQLQMHCTAGCQSISSKLIRYAYTIKGMPRDAIKAANPSAYARLKSAGSVAWHSATHLFSTISSGVPGRVSGNTAQGGAPFRLSLRCTARTSGSSLEVEASEGPVHGDSMLTAVVLCAGVSGLYRATLSCARHSIH